MAAIKVINMDQKEASTLEVSDAILQAPWRPYILRDAVVYQMAKLRQGTHATKTRANVSGSTRKLFKQKGTGNARSGDIKAPHRRHGGIALGPQPRSHAIGMNKKTRKLALSVALGKRFRDNDLIVVEGLEPKTHKTKEMANWLKGLKVNKGLIVVDDWSENLVLSTSNLANVLLLHYTQLNPYWVMKFPRLVVTRQAMERIQERLVG